MVCTSHQISLGDRIKVDEMGVVCGMYGTEEKCIQPFGGETKERDYLENLGVEKRIILKWI